jgi:hypothetical protein
MDSGVIASGWKEITDQALRDILPKAIQTGHNMHEAIIDTLQAGIEGKIYPSGEKLDQAPDRELQDIIRRVKLAFGGDFFLEGVTTEAGRQILVTLEADPERSADLIKLDAQFRDEQVRNGQPEGPGLFPFVETAMNDVMSKMDSIFGASFVPD